MGPHGLNTQSTHGLRYFLHDLTALERAVHDRMVEDDFEFDQVIGGLDVHDRTTLVQAGHDRMVMDSFKIA